MCPTSDVLYDKGGAVYNVLASGYGVTGGGSVDDYSALNTLLNTTIPSSGGTVVFPAGAYKIGTSLTVPDYVTTILLEGAVLKPQTGATVTFEGALQGTPTNHFDYTGGGDVALIATTPKDAYPQWWGAVGNGVDPCAVAFQRAIDAVDHEARIVLLPGIYIIEQVVTVSKYGVHVVGAGRFATQLVFAPTENGTCFRIAPAAGVITNGSIRDLAFWSNDSTYEKVALELVSIGSYEISNIGIGGSRVVENTGYWSDDNERSIGLSVQGHEFSMVKNIVCSADRPIVIGNNPKEVASFDLDHFHFEDLYLIANANPCVEIESGTVIQHTRFDGQNAWVRGTYGLLWEDTVSGDPAQSIGLTLSGIGGENGTDDTAYLVKITFQAGGLHQLAIRDCIAGQERNGFYFERVYDIELDNVMYLGGSGTTALHATAGALTPELLSIKHCYWAPGCSATLTGMRLMWGNSHIFGPIPRNAVYQRDVETYRDIFLGGPVAERRITLANNSSEELTPAVGFLYVVSGIHVGAQFFLMGSSHSAILMAESHSGYYTATKDNPGTTNVYWDTGGAGSYRIQNKTGNTRTFSVFCIGTGNI